MVILRDVLCAAYRGQRWEGSRSTQDGDHTAMGPGGLRWAIDGGSVFALLAQFESLKLNEERK